MPEAALSTSLSIKTDGPDIILRVLNYRLTQDLDACGHLHCTVYGDVKEEFESVKDCLGRSTTFVFENDKTGKKQFFHGDVWSSHNRSDSDGVKYLVLEILDALWPLKHRSNSRVFQPMSTSKIIETVLTEAKISLALPSQSELEDKVQKYCVQYEESDLHFIRRILGREGFSWLLRHNEAGSSILFTNALCQVHEGSAVKLAFRPVAGDNHTSDTVTHLEQVLEVRPDQLRTSAYDPHHPSQTIEETQEASEIAGGGSEIYEPLTSLPSSDRAKSTARNILDGHQVRRNILYGRSAAEDLQLASLIQIHDHPYEPLNGDFVIFSLRHYGAKPRNTTHTGEAHTGTEESSRNGLEFWAIPKEKVWRPEAPRSRAIVPGLQTAITTGAPDEEIHTNEHGEVKVQFHWDRHGAKNHTSSKFLRTGQLPTAGAMLLPRVGWEVAVAYLEGDVEEPIVLSRLFNGATMPPYELPGSALRSSMQTGTTPVDGSTNELRMDDTKGDEQMMFNASKDMSTQVGNNTTQSVGNDLSVEVGANQDLSVIDSFQATVNGNQSTTITGNLDESVSSKSVDEVALDHNANVGANLTQMIGGDHKHTVEASNSHTVQGNALSVAVGSISLDAVKGFDHKVGAVLLKVVGSDRSVIVGKAKTESTDGAKIIIVKGKRSVEAGTLNTTIGGAALINADGKRSDSADKDWTETVGGQVKIEAKNITLTGEQEVKLTMGNAVIKLTPVSVSITGKGIKVKGNLVQTSPMNINN